MNKTTLSVLVIIIVLGGWYAYTRVGSTPPKEEQTTDTTSMEETTMMEEENSMMAAKTPIQEGNYFFVKEDSMLTWEGRKTLIADYVDSGTIMLSSGSFRVEEGALQEGELTIDMTSIAAKKTGKGSGESMLSGHLKSDAFFDAANYPTATFVISKAEAIHPETGSTMLTGVLTMKGISKEITFPAEIYTENGQGVIDATVILDRTLWDVRFGSDTFFDNLADNVIDDEFTVRFHLVANPGK